MVNLLEAVMIIKIEDTSSDYPHPEISSIFPQNYLQNCNGVQEEIINQTLPEQNFDVTEDMIPVVHNFSIQSIKGNTVFFSCLSFAVSDMNNSGEKISCYVLVACRHRNYHFSEILAKFIYLSGINEQFPDVIPLLEELAETPLTFNKFRYMNLKLLGNFDAIKICSAPEYYPPTINDKANLLEIIGSEDLTLLIFSLLFERRIILLGETKEQLALKMETLLDLIYPFKWCHLYLTFAGSKTIKKLKKYDEPFFVGVLRDVYVESEQFNAPQDTLVFDVDMCSKMSNFDSGIPNFLEKLKKVHKWYKKALYNFPSPKSQFKFFVLIMNEIFQINSPFEKNRILKNFLLKNKCKITDFFDFSNLTKNDEKSENFDQNLTKNNENLSKLKENIENLKNNLINNFEPFFELNSNQNYSFLTRNYISMLPLQKDEEYFNPISTEKYFFEIRKNGIVSPSEKEQKMSQNFNKAKVEKFSRDFITDEAKKFLKALFNLHFTERDKDGKKNYVKEDSSDFQPTEEECSREEFDDFKLDKKEDENQPQSEGEIDDEFVNIKMPEIGEEELKMAMEKERKEREEMLRIENLKKSKKEEVFNLLKNSEIKTINDMKNNKGILELNSDYKRALINHSEEHNKKFENFAENDISKNSQFENNCDYLADCVIKKNKVEN